MNKFEKALKHITGFIPKSIDQSEEYGVMEYENIPDGVAYKTIDGNYIIKFKYINMYSIKEGCEIIIADRARIYRCKPVNLSEILLELGKVFNGINSHRQPLLINYINRLLKKKIMNVLSKLFNKISYYLYEGKQLSVNETTWR